MESPDDLLYPPPPTSPISYTFLKHSYVYIVLFFLDEPAISRTERLEKDQPMHTQGKKIQFRIHLF